MSGPPSKGDHGGECVAFGARSISAGPSLPVQTLRALKARVLEDVPGRRRMQAFSWPSITGSMLVRPKQGRRLVDLLRRRQVHSAQLMRRKGAADTSRLKAVHVPNGTV